MYPKLRRHGLQQSKAARISEWSSYPLKTIAQRRQWTEFKLTVVRNTAERVSMSPVLDSSAEPQAQIDDVCEVSSCGDARMMLHDQRGYYEVNDQAADMTTALSNLWPAHMSELDGLNTNIDYAADTTMLDRPHTGVLGLGHQLDGHSPLQFTPVAMTSIQANSSRVEERAPMAERMSSSIEWDKYF